MESVKEAAMIEAGVDEAGVADERYINVAVVVLMSLEILKS